MSGEGNPFNEPVYVGVGLRQRRAEAQAQVGGALLGKGVYGCTFKPAPPCAGGKVFTEIGGLPAVGKISDRPLTEEVGVGRALMALPLARNYFAVPVVECRPATPIRDEDADRCDVLRDAGFFTKLSEAIMPDAGRPLLKWGADLERAAAGFEDLFVHLLEGMILYQDAGFVHNDVHWGNIMVDDRGVARYIDFGLAFRPDSVRRWRDSGLGKEFKPQYMWQAPEIHAARLYMGRQSVAYGVGRLKAKTEEYGELERAFPRRQSLEAAMAGFLRAVDQSEEGLGSYLRRYGVRLDWWRLGLCMWQMWMDLARGLDVFRGTALYRDRRDAILRVIGGMSDFNPMTRMSPREALRILRPDSRMAAAE
jgi:hypothetical protein